MGRFFSKHKTLKIIAIIFIVVNVYSFLPVIKLYLTGAPSAFKKNHDVARELAGNKEPYFSFIVMSDTSSGCFFMESATLKLISGMNREDRFHKCPIDFVINIGDVTFRGRESHYRNYAKIRAMIKYPVITAIGNHDDDIDDGEKGKAIFEKYCGEKEFSFIDRNVYFIVLDNKNGEFREDQFEWFSGELEKARGYDHTFIFMHKPPFNPYQQSWYRVETNPWSHRFMKMCEEYKVDIVFSGHEYINRITEFGGVTYIVSGGGGALLHEAPSWDNAFLHYIVVKVNNDYIDYEVRKIFPPIWEFFTFYLWKDLIYFARGLLN